MNRNKNVLIINGFMLCIGILLMSCTGRDGGRPVSFEHIVIIGIDGLTIEGLQKSETPVLNNLITNGAIKYDARTVLPSSTVPNWGAQIHGAAPEASGITSNNWQRQPDEPRMSPVVKNKAGFFPGIFDIIREQLPNAEQGLMLNWPGFGFAYHFENLLQRKVVNRFDIYPDAPEEITRQACDYIISKKPTFFFIILNHVDGAGHDYGFKSEEYMQAVANADGIVGRIIDSIYTAGMKNNTLVMVLSDHGGAGRRHGGESDDEINIPYIFYGNGVKKNYKIQQPVYAYDIAATVAFALNLKVPYAWTGRPVLAAFEGYQEPE
jgi:predicted AlkP superfamily pyrophosphatase or phosphodiesterase